MSDLTAPWWLLIARGVFELCALMSIGCLVVAALVPADQVARLGRLAGRWAIGWWLATAVYLVADGSYLTGLRPADLIGSPQWLLFVVDLPTGRALLFVLVAAFALALWGGAIGSRAAAIAATAAAAMALMPFVAGGHAATASSHFVATESLLIHVSAVLLWVGGLAALVLHTRTLPGARSAAAPGYSRLAGWCFLAVAGSGLVSAWVRLGLAADVVSSTYGRLLLAKTTLLMLIGVAGWWHRRRTLRSLAQGRPRAFALLATTETLAMALTVALAVALSQTNPPASALIEAAPPHAARYASISPDLAGLTSWRLLTEHHASPLMVTWFALGATGLLWWQRTRDRGAGRRRRTLLLVAGLAAAWWALAGGVASYAPAVASVQVAQLLIASLVAAPLMIAGLSAVAFGWAGARRLVAHRTGIALAALAAWTVTLHLGAMSAALASATFHALLGIGALALGITWFASLAAAGGTDAASDEGIGDWRLGMGILAAVIAGDGVRVWQSGRLPAQGWYDAVGGRWLEIGRDTELTALVLLVGGVVAAAALWWAPRLLGVADGGGVGLAAQSREEPERPSADVDADADVSLRHSLGTSASRVTSEQDKNSASLARSSLT